MLPPAKKKVLLGVGFFDAEQRPVDLTGAARLLAERVAGMSDDRKIQFFCSIAGLVYTFGVDDPPLRHATRAMVEAVERELFHLIGNLGWGIAARPLAPQEVSSSASVPKEQLQ